MTDLGHGAAGLEVHTLGDTKKFSEVEVQSFGTIGALRRHLGAVYAEDRAKTNKEGVLTPYNIQIGLFQGEHLLEDAMLLELPVDPPLVLTAVVSEEPKPFVDAGRQVCRQFREACARGAVGDVEEFLQLPLDPNARELCRHGPRGTPLQEAVSGRNLALVQCLLKARADPNARTSSGGYSDDRPVAQAALHAVKGPYFDRAEILKALVHARADVTETLFPVLARTGSEHNESREQVVRMLLDAGARPVHKAYVTKYEDGPSSTLELAERFPAILAMLHSAMTPQTRQQHLQEQLGRRLRGSLQKDRGRWFDSV